METAPLARAKLCHSIAHTITRAGWSDDSTIDSNELSLCFDDAAYLRCRRAIPTRGPISTSGNNGNSSEINGSATANPIYWLRLTRTGNSFVGDGRLPDVGGAPGTWTVVATKTVGMNSSVLVGLAVTPRDGSFLNKAVFDNISITTSSGTITLGSSNAVAHQAFRAQIATATQADCNPYSDRYFLRRTASAIGATTSSTNSQQRSLEKLLVDALAEVENRRA